MEDSSTGTVQEDSACAEGVAVQSVSSWETPQGSESEAYLELPPADFETHVSELVTEHLGEMDYQLKKQAVNFWAFLAGVQEVRKGVQEGRHKSGE